MKKNRNKPKSSVVILPSPIILLILLLGIGLAALSIFPEVQRYQIRNEIFTYVQENKDSIDLHDPQYTQYFEYSEWGLIDAGVIYGYIYSPNNEYSSYGKKYRRGYRSDGPTTYGDGWFYFEKICDNWFYYEEHYG